MDNLAHTLVGAVLGRAVGDRRTPLPALVGAVAANAPDWTELFAGGGSYYAAHRGITHSFLGAAVEIAGLTLLVGLGAAWAARRSGTAPPRLRWIALTVAVTVLSHLLLDWQGSYGLRPFLPWNGTRYYGDWVAIVDPFFWLVPLFALAWGAPRHWLAALPLAGAAALMVLVLGADLGRVAPWVVALFVVALPLCGIGWIAHWVGVVGRRRAAVAAVLCLALYDGAGAVTSRFAKAAAQRAAVARFGPGARSAALTVAGRPFTWEPVYASADTVAGPGWALARHLSDPRVRAALQTPDGRAMAEFARFLVADVERSPSGGGVTVLLSDARFARGRRRGWGVVAIRMAGG